MATEKRKKKARGRPPKQETPQLPATFDEIMQSVVKTKTPEEIEAMLEEERVHEGTTGLIKDIAKIRAKAKAKEVYQDSRDAQD